MKMSIEDLRRRARMASTVAIQEAKINGVPIVYSDKGKVVKEYPSGRKTIVVREGGEVKEFEHH